MIAEGYAWEYDGGTKNKNFHELRDIRYQQGTLAPPPDIDELVPDEGDPLPEVGDGLQSTTAANLPGLY